MRWVLGLVMVGVTSATTWAQVPHVLDSVPRNGDLQVDPGLTWLAFAFDSDMATGSSYSVCKDLSDPSTFPKLTGTIGWVDSRLFVAKVQLEPGHDYRLILNGPPYQGFHDAQGHPLASYSVMFRTSSGTPSLTAEINTKAVQELRRCIDEEYSYRDLRGLDWDALFAQYSSSLIQTKTATQFAQIVATMLTQAKDLHIAVLAGGQVFPTFTPQVSPNVNSALLPTIVPNLNQVNSVVWTGRYPDGITYIRIATWDQSSAAALEAVYPALWDAASAAGLILDVRLNNGGAEDLAQQVAGCFVDESHVYARDVIRSPKYAGGFSSPYDRVLLPNKERPRYRGPVVVLMGPFDISACESFLLMMQKVPLSTLMGEKSYGASGNPIAHDLGNGVTVWLPCWKDLCLDGTCFEGEGIAPDVEVHATQAQLAVGDPVLDAALAWLRQNKR